MALVWVQDGQIGTPGIGSPAWQNEDGTLWQLNNELPSWAEENIRPDLRQGEIANRIKQQDEGAAKIPGAQRITVDELKARQQSGGTSLQGMGFARTGEDYGWLLPSENFNVTPGGNGFWDASPFSGSGSQAWGPGSFNAGNGLGAAAVVAFGGPAIGAAGTAAAGAGAAGGAAAEGAAAEGAAAEGAAGGAAAGETGAGGALAGPTAEQLATNAAMAESASAGATSFGPGTAGAFDAGGTGTGIDTAFASDAGLSAVGEAPPVVDGGVGAGGGAGGGGSSADSSIFTGDTPTDVPNPFPDETITPASETSTGAGGGIQDALNALTKYGPLALQGVNMARGPAQTKAYSTEIRNVGQTQRAAAEEMVAQARAGQINPADQYDIDQWQASALAQSRAYFAKAGLSDSTMATKAEADIAAKAAAMKAKARADLLNTGMQALNVVDKYTAMAIQAQMQGDQAAAKQVTDFLNSYGNWLRTLPTMTGQSGTGTTPKSPEGTAAVTA